MRNAYVLIYKRKLTDESLIVNEDEAASATANEPNPEAASQVVPYKLGATKLQLELDNPLNKKIEWDNHRYWHIRYLFREEYSNFVTRTLRYWHTHYIIQREISWRNQSDHLIENPFFASVKV